MSAESKMFFYVVCVIAAFLLGMCIRSTVLQEQAIEEEDRQTRQAAARNVLDSCEEHAGRFDERACMLARHEELMTRLMRLERILLDAQRGRTTPRD